MNLFEHVSSNPHLDLRLFVGNNYQLAVKDLPGLECAYGGLLKRLAARRVGVALRNVHRLAEALLLLDGVCAQIVILPEEVEPCVMDAFIRHTATEFVLSDFLEREIAGVVVESFETCKDNPPPRIVDTDWILPTSGTTGVPKLIIHSVTSLTRTVKQGGVRGGDIVWGLLYQLGRFAGLQVYFQSLLGGSTLVLPDSSTLPIEQQLICFSKNGVNALSATPTMWRKILMSSSAKTLSLNRITLGGEIATQGIIDALSAYYPAARVTHIYASTEFGVGFSVADGLEGFPAGWLMSSTTNFTVDSESNELMVTTNTVDLPLGTGDLVELRGDRAVFLGRINGSINVGGNKVMPEEVERVLLMFPGVNLAAVSAVKNSIMGNLVKAEVVAGPSDLALNDYKKSLIAHCRVHLEPYKVPAILNIVEQLCISASGKIQRT